MKKLTWKEVVAKNNTSYEKATRAEKRVLIAKDVLKFIDSKLIDATRGRYLEIKFKKQPAFDPWCNPLDRLDGSRSFKEVIGKEIISCKVCAKGAIFVATVARQNDVSVRETQDLDMTYHGDLSKSLKNIFSPKQLDVIENFFESRNVFETRHWADKETLEIIMKNIIRNKGTFIPSQDI